MKSNNLFIIMLFILFASCRDTKRINSPSKNIRHLEGIWHLDYRNTFHENILEKYFLRFEEELEFIEAPRKNKIYSRSIKGRSYMYETCVDLVIAVSKKAKTFPSYDLNKKLLLHVSKDSIHIDFPNTTFHQLKSDYNFDQSLEALIINMDTHFITHLDSSILAIRTLKKGNIMDLPLIFKKTEAN